MDISSSEIQQFLRCRRMWDIGSVNRQGLRKAGIPALALEIGSALHESFDAQASGRDPFEAIETYCAQRAQEVAAEYRANVGVNPSPVELTTFIDAQDHAKALVMRYFGKYGVDNPIAPYEYVRTEQTFRIPIPGTDGYFIGTFDGLARDPMSGRLWIVEHKTYSVKPDYDKMTTDHQITAYCWAALQLFGALPEGVLYDGLNKKLPTVPAILKNGKVSTAKGDSDAETLIAALVANSQSPDDPAYKETLDYYRAREESPQGPFFTRWQVRVNAYSVQQFEYKLIAAYREMSNPDTAIIPNFLWNGCNDCFVRDLCKVVQFGEDWDYATREYVKSTGYGTTQRAESGVSEPVGSFMDIL